MFLCADFDSLGWDSSLHDVEQVIDKYSSELTGIVESLRDSDGGGVSMESVHRLNYASGVMKAAWNVPCYGHQVGGNLCDTLREMGGLDLLLSNFSSDRSDLKVASARLLEQSLTPDNCNYVVQKGLDSLDKVVKVCAHIHESSSARVDVRNRRT